MPASDRIEFSRDRFVRRWLSRVLRQDDSHGFEPPDGIISQRAAQEPGSTQNREQHGRHEAYQSRRKKSMPCRREEPRVEEHRDKRHCAGRTESIRSLSIGPSRHSDRLTLDTPFQQFTRQHHLQQPHTLTRVSQHCPAASSSPLSRLQRSKPRKPKEHINLISSPENCGRARRMVSTSDTPNRTKEYGRKPRRKTRLDRYDPKDAGKHPRKSTKDGKKKKPNPKKGHRRLSRAVIGEEFKAPNIKQDRLTLTSNPGLGLFRNGKTSSPKRRRELPDLSFSEMGFLAKRQSRENQKPPGESTGKEISHYFSQLPPIERVHSVEPGRMQSQYRQISNRSCSVLDTSQISGFRPNRQPDNSPVTFPNQHAKSGNSPPSLRASARESESRRRKSDNAKISSYNAQNTKPSTTYYTWSESDHRIIETRGNNKQPSETAVRDDAEKCSRLPPFREDSHSGNPLEHKAENIIFQNAKLNSISQTTPLGRVQRYLTLDDLHNLANADTSRYDEAHPAEIAEDDMTVKRNANSNDNRAKILPSPENLSTRSQTEGGNKQPSSAAPKGVPNSLTESSNRLGVAMADSNKSFSAVDLATRDCERHVSDRVKRSEQRTETKQFQTSQTHRIPIGSSCDISPPKKGIRENRAFPRQFIGVGDSRPHFLISAMKDRASERCPTISMPEDCLPEMELEKAKLDDFHNDFAGLDAFDREVLETGTLNATFQAEGSSGGNDHNHLSFLLPVSGEGMPELPSRDAFCVSDAIPASHPLFHESDARLPTIGENNHYGTKVFTHGESKYADTFPPPNLIHDSFEREHMYKHGRPRGYEKSTPGNGNLELRTWDSAQWNWRNAYSHGAIHDLRDGLPWMVAAYDERQGEYIKPGRIGERENSPADFWRPNRLY